MFFLLAIYGIQVFALYFLRDVLKAENPIKLTGDLLASITVALVIAALAGGWLGDRLGHTRMSYLASAIGALGCLLMLWARTPAAVHDLWNRPGGWHRSVPDRKLGLAQRAGSSLPKQASSWA